MKTVKFYTLGCKVNQYDTQEMREAFLRSGFRELSNGKKAGYYLINTCTVTGRADSASLSLVRKARQENPRAKIIVTGCLTELDSARIKAVDKKSLITKNADKAAGGISFFAGHTRAFLKVQDGCDNFCSYCKVPLVRGRSRSKPLSQIICEAKNLAKNGFKEIVLTGICLGAYGKDLSPPSGLAQVTEELEKIGRLLRIRLSSIEAADISDRLIARMRVSKKLCRHLHIPIQSGDNTILKKMRRSYTREQYLALVSKIKKFIPGIAITTDVLVGFPGEEERHFRNTLELVKKIQPLKAHIFPYSEREATFAANNFKEKVPADIIKSRCLRMKSLADACAADFKKKFLNKKMKVLFEAKLRPSALCNKFSTVHKGVWGRPSPTFGGCSVSEANAEGGLAPLAEVRCDSPKLTTQRTRAGWWQGYTDNYIKVTLKSRRNLKNKILKIPLT